MQEETSLWERLLKLNVELPLLGDDKWHTCTLVQYLLLTESILSRYAPALLWSEKEGMRFGCEAGGSKDLVVFTTHPG
jgi:hypothetical protein